MQQRTVIGRLWLELVVRHYLACRDADEQRRAKLFDLIDLLTDEYPDAIQAEIGAMNAEEPSPMAHRADPKKPNGAVGKLPIAE